MNETPDTSDETEDQGPRKLRPEEQDPKRWMGDGWTARVIKNEDDDGWAVEMTADGQSEPSLVGPWTMGRDKKNPKPIDTSSFAALVKGANEILMRHEQQRRAQLHRSVSTTGPDDARLTVDLDIVPDEDDPHAFITVKSDLGEVLSKTRVAPDFKLTADSARKWVVSGASRD
jgi:hypothetical protein